MFFFAPKTKNQKMQNDFICRTDTKKVHGAFLDVKNVKARYLR